ncbi:uncharacterized protein EI90DRAFT_2918034 [Cantharellus anzutake]|uniref:uncharacterized protein n=1 Tax=Cantharellus anzutake TaxID=1750568 RepID=UPI001906D38F|nr:uncharacterized protein EI90DRAFT_2918034 [Cantharellus anzutake]KAF8332858.1 hypothetical protein EI90DRAFT_2918034 [Cantharellus anzutake]
MDSVYAFMDYCAQGQTIDYLWADIRTPLKGSLTPFNVYVTLSRAQGRSNVRLLQDFKDSLFMTTPCEVLEQEDKQLMNLNRETKQDWERRQGRRGQKMDG